MKKNKSKLIIAGVMTLVLALCIGTSSAEANSTTTKSTSSRVLIKENKMKERIQVKGVAGKATSTKVVKGLPDAIEKADKAIEERIDSLNKTSEKIQEMKNVSDVEKASINDEIQAEISKLTALKSKIDADTDLATIKKDLASMTSGSRIYILIIPRANILASVDKINTIGTMLETISVKLQTRLDELKATGVDVSVLQKSLDSIKTKVADAKKEALTAQTTVSTLTPDNGDKTKLASNNADLKSAKANIKTANEDLKFARKAASIVSEGLKSPSDRDQKTDKNDTKVKPGKAVNKPTTKK